MNQKDATALAKKIAADAQELKKMIRSSHENGHIVDGPVMDALRAFALDGITDLELVDSYLFTYEKVGRKSYRFFPTNHATGSSADVVIENKIPANADK